MSALQRLSWHPRVPVAPPAGVVAWGTVARALLRELARRDAAQLAALQAVAAADLLCVLGPADQLPWVDGVRYCAPAADAAGLWLPTTLAPTQPAELVLAALERRTGQAMQLLWPEPELVLPLQAVQPLNLSLLAWLAEALA